jgi:Uri superfamily endonuclease
MPERKTQPNGPQGGAYLLHLYVKSPLALNVGALGAVNLPSGYYVYVGSAQKSIAGRIGRHTRLAESKAGKLHWHIDYLLVHPETLLIRTDKLSDLRECSLAKRISSMPGASIPVPGFGATDCRSGCGAHLFRIDRPGPAAKGSDKKKKGRPAFPVRISYRKSNDRADRDQRRDRSPSRPGPGPRRRRPCPRLRSRIAP